VTSPVFSGLAGSAGGGAGGVSGFASPIGLDRLVRKEVGLGAIRERTWPEDHIGLRLIAPFMDVETDDVIFDYIKGGFQDGLGPARAEDAEAELSQKDDLLYGSGRAAVVDWALKDKYTASDVTRYRDDLLTAQILQGQNAGLHLNTPFNSLQNFQNRVAKHDGMRRKRLDNRIEWLIMSQAVETGGVAYNDGKIKFTVDYGRPAGQHNQPISIKNSSFTGPQGRWNKDTSHDPIGDIMSIKQYMYDTYGVWITRAVTSQKNLNYMWASSRFLAAQGMVVGGTPSSPIDIRYVNPGFDQAAAIAAVERATGVTFIAYDSVYWTRPIGSTTRTMNRFTTESKIFFLPTEGDLGEIDDTDIGFAKTLTSPHPEGNWQSGYYEWETEERDPWMRVRGSGIKAFPVFPYMEYTFTADVTVNKDGSTT
jgi:hypothetical protein